MHKTFFYLTLFILAIACVVLIVPEIQDKPENPARTFLSEVHSGNRYVSSDELAKRIIDGDPTLFMVDVRSEEEFNDYSIPGAVNIPLAQVLDDDRAGQLDQQVLDVVFFSNDDFDAEQAWALCKRQGYSNLYVLDGGLNQWFATIMLPEKPGELATSDELDLYSFRTGASIFFGSGTVTVPVMVEVEEEPEPEVKKTIPVKKKVKIEDEGGC